MRQRMTLRFLALVLSLSGIGVLPAQGPTSRQIPFTLTTTLAPGSTGQAVQVEIWDQASGGTLIFSESQTVNVDDSGSISVLAGSQTPGGLDPNNFPSSSSRYLDVTQAGASVLSGRITMYASAFALTPGPPGPAGPQGPQGPPGTFSGTFTGDTTFNGNARINGNVGIGTMNPGAKLEISDSAEASIKLTTTTTNPNQILFNRPDKQWRIANETDLRIYPNLSGGSPYFTITNAGNVGIGTISPSQLLTVEKNAGQTLVRINGVNDSSTLQIGSNLTTEGGNLGNITFHKGGSTSFAWLVARSDAGNSGHFEFYTHDGTSLAERVRISSQGNLGIGTVNPLSKLHTVGAAASTGTGSITSSGFSVTGSGTAFTTELHVGDTILAQGQAQIVQAITSPTSLTTTLPFSPALSNVAFTFQQPILRLADSTGAPQFMVNSVGNVGIGTTSPRGLFEVYGSSPVVKLTQNPSLPGDTKLILSAAGTSNVAQITLGDAVLQSNTADNRSLILNPGAGNVGIGGAPNAKLQVTGGDAAISTQGNGLILKATNGPNCFRVTVNNTGALTTAPVTCP